MSAAAPSLNTRHFYVGTYDRANIRLYIDGAQVASAPATAAIPSTTQPLAIGNKPTSTDARDPWPGVLDEVSIHNVALGAAQVSQLWSTGSAGPGTGAGDPTTLDGSLLRVDPSSGVGGSGNPLAGSTDANERRVIAHGFRNPFRFAFRPGTSELWVGDVGWNDWEEIDRITTPTSSLRELRLAVLRGHGRQSGYDGADVSICENLYAVPSAVSAPYYTYNHAAKVVAGETCPTGSSSITGLAFYQGGTYPAAYADALFFADYSRNCIWVMKAGDERPARPEPARDVRRRSRGARRPRDRAGRGPVLRRHERRDDPPHPLHRLRRSPTAVIAANPTSGQAPLTVQFDGTGSSDPESGALSYAWDLDGDGALDDSTAASPSFTYTTAGTRTVRLQVTDPQQLTGSTTRLIDVTGTGGGQTYSQLIGSMSPVAYWRLGETSGTSAADSAGSTTGTYAGGFTLGVAGLLTGDTNRAVQLNGTTGQVTLPNAAALNPTSAISIAGWLNSTSFTNRNPRIFQKGINDTQYRLLVEGGQLVFQITGVGTVTGPLPSLNTRHFVVGTYDRTTMRLYLDGTQVGQTAATAAIPVTSEPAAIGNKPTSTDARDPFPGVLDDVSIHNVALSAAQVGQLWTTGTTGSGGGTNTPPVPVIDTPAASVTWKVGDTISFTGHATDAEDGTLAASRLSWSLDPRSLPVELPHAQHPELERRRERLVPGSRSRLPLGPAVDAHRHGQRRHAGVDERQARPEDGGPVVRVVAHGSAADPQRLGGDSTVHPDGHPRLRELDQCRSEPDGGRPELRVPVLVRRRCTGPHGDRRQLDDADRDVHGVRRRGRDGVSRRGARGRPGQLLAVGRGGRDDGRRHGRRRPRDRTRAG